MHAMRKRLLLSTLLAAAGGAWADVPASVQPVLREFCIDCHNAKKHKGDLDMEPLLADPKFSENRDVWEKAADLLSTREMPPEKKPQPGEAQRQAVVQFIDGELTKLDAAAGPNPGKVTLRRLNKEEYRRTIFDLLRVDFQPADFPTDEVGYGFNNIGDVLSLSPMLMEKYLVAAEAIAKKAIMAEPAKVPRQKLRGERFSSPDDSNHTIENNVFGLYREGEATASAEFARAGDYVLHVRAYGEQAGTEPPKMRVKFTGAEMATFDVKNERAKTFDVPVTAAAGKQPIVVAYLNNYVNRDNPDPKLRGDRNLFIESVEIEGPLGVEASDLPEAHRRIVTRMPAAGEELKVAREILAPFVQRAYRRPAGEADVERLVGFVDLALKNRGSFLEGVQAALQAALCSPKFLFRWELDPEAVNPGEVRALTDFEVASRLSYFLWSSMPDDELFALAEKGGLLKDGNVGKQVKRMLQDGRARALVENFGGQWLQIHNIYEVDPDPKTFPNFSPELREDMKRETFAFLEAIVKEDRSVLDLIDADFTFLNERLAKHYGIDGVQGGEFQRVALPKGSPRGGVLAQGAVLLATSMPTRTSPVIRGKWILEQILGTPPPPPPANVPPLDAANVDLDAPLRKRLEQHRADPDCAGCHAKMDPLGFALENFDALGVWRTMEGKNPIDASGTLPNGTEFNGPAELKRILKTDKFVRSLAQKMMTYGLGRGLERFDKRAVEGVVATAKAGEYKFSALVTAIVTSEPFLKRKTEPKLAGN